MKPAKFIDPVRPAKIFKETKKRKIYQLIQQSFFRILLTLTLKGKLLRVLRGENLGIIASFFSVKVENGHSKIPKGVSFQ